MMDNGNRKNIIYGNILVLAPNGAEMFLCTDKRAEWYLSRGLAKKIDETTLKFTFEPKGYGADGDKYLLGSKNNACVVCGLGDLVQLTKHHIVPSEYRKLFPDIYKSRNSHDIVIICREHHRVYENIHAISLKESLAEKYDAPIHKTQTDSYISAVKAAGVIAKHKEKIPVKRKEELIMIIFKGTLEEKIGDKYIKKLSKVDLGEYMSSVKSHAQIVMEKIEDLQEFTEIWRQDFLDAMHPQFMPEYWKLDRKL